MRRGTTHTTAVLLASVALLAGACGGDSDGSGGTADAGQSGARPTSTPSTTTSGDSSEESAPPTGPPRLGEVDVSLDPLGVSLDSPTDVHASGGTLLVTERNGRVVELVPDATGDYEVAGTVVDLRDEVGSTEAERGLLGLTTDRDETHLYVNHTRTDDGATVVAEYTLSGAPGSRRADARRELLVIDQPFPNHNAGDMEWGPDDMLWVPTGDGGSRNDPEGRAQRLSDPLGKLLRLDPSLAGSGDELAPADNPYVEDPDANALVWARGLRNPWRISFDPATGDLWIADVGQDRVEEISVLRADDGTGRGADLGWDRFEGNELFDDPGPTDGWPDDDAILVGPLHTYPHDGRCSISGGYLYRGSIAGLDGAYLFSDFCDGQLWALASDGTAVDLGVAAESVVSVNPDEAGEAIVVSAGGLYRLS